MCREVFELVKNMDLSNVETRLALQCAPVIMGIKVSNLLCIKKEDEALVESILNGTRIAFYCLGRQNKRTIYLLFRSPEFEKYLNKVSVQKQLFQYGYRELSFLGVLGKFKKRYTGYMRNQNKFPHELGILLGYPIEDVDGFIKNKGENYLYAGYWKVYKDVEEKKLLFDAYESAKEGVLLLVAHGYSIRSIIEYAQDHFVY